LPGVREWIGDRQFKQLRAANYTLANKKWESSLEFEKDDVDDDRTGSFLPQIKQLADEATYHPDELLFTVQFRPPNRPPATTASISSTRITRGVIPARRITT
jgi:phage major head subunit gpT-like protein